MKKKLWIILGCVLVALIIVGLFTLKILTNKEAEKLLKNLNDYKFKIEDLETGKHFKFKGNKYFKNINITDGIIYKDIDNTILIVSNVKINGLYCKYDSKFDCSLFNKKNTNIKKLKTYNNYKVGDPVTLLDNTKWHVINDSNEYSKYVTLISDERIDINNDGFKVDTGSTNDPDRIAFSTDGSKVYDVNNTNNIGYYINNTYKSSLTLLKDIYEIRILNSKELENIERQINFEELTEEQIQNMYVATDELTEFLREESPRPFYKLKDVKVSEEQYKKLMPHWLFNSMSGNYWVIYNKTIRTAVWNGAGYTSAKATTKYSLKPVMTLSKENIKK